MTAASSVYVQRWIDANRNPNGTIYLVLNVMTGEEYVGYTRNPVKKRWYQMVSAANAGTKGLLYDSIRAFGKGNFIIKVLYQCDPDENVEQLTREYIEEYNPDLNREL